MRGRPPYLLWSYVTLLVGSLSTSLLFWSGTGIKEQISDGPRLLGFVAWFLAPYLLVTLNTFLISRFILKEGTSDGTLFGGALFFVLSGFLIYGRVLLAQEGKPMESNFVFIFGPLQHFIVAVLTTIIYFVKSFFRLLSSTGRQ